MSLSFAKVMNTFHACLRVAASAKAGKDRKVKSQRTEK